MRPARQPRPAARTFDDHPHFQHTFGTRPQSVPVQQPSPMPFHRYRAFPPIDLPDRTWPSESDHRGPALAVAPTSGTATRP